MAAIPKQTTQFLRQRGTGHLYHWTPQLAVRPDMVPHDDEAAEVQKRALMRRLEEIERIESEGRLKTSKLIGEKLEKAQKNLKTLQEIEDDIASIEHQIRQAQEAEAAEERGETPPPSAEPELTAEEKAEAARKEKLEADGEIQRIKAMKSKAEVAQYLAENYGVERNPEESKLEPLRDEALKLREARIDELEALNQ